MGTLSPETEIQMTLGAAVNKASEAVIYLSPEGIANVV
jgi:hypothetical protein